MENENDIYPDSINHPREFPNVKVLSVMLTCAAVAVILGLLSVYGGYKLITKNSDKAYVAQLEQTIVRRESLIVEREYKIKSLQKNIALLHQTQDLEHFLMMILDENQKKDFLTIEDYCKQFFMDHRK